MRLRTIGPVFFLLALCVPGASAQETGTVPFFSLDYVERVGDDLVGLPRVIWNWDATDWGTAASIAGAGALAYTVDGDVRRDFYNHNPEDAGDLSSAFTHFGDWHYELPLLGAAAIGGLSGSSELNRVASDGVEASAIAAGVIGPLLVYATGRELPNKNLPAHSFHPFTGHKYSFPSGHTAEAFAVSTVLDHAFRERFGYWHVPIVYAAAAAVGISRIRDRRHYLSDVIIGAGIGWGVGAWVSHRHHPPPPAALQDAPLTPGRIPAPDLPQEGSTGPMR
jgi:membrane-associated phospholipid phosphatase